MTILASTFIFDYDGKRFRVGCACGWRAAATTWRSAERLERRHRCEPPTTGPGFTLACTGCGARLDPTNPRSLCACTAEASHA